MDTLIALLEIITWPTVVIIVVFVLKDDLISLLEKIKSANFRDLTVEFGKAEVDKPTLEKKTPNTTSSTPDFKAGNIGNIYWLGHDVMWTIDVLLRNGSKDAIEHGIRQCLHHANEAGFPISKLNKLQEIVEDSLEMELTTSKRQEIANELLKTSNQLGEPVGSRQSGVMGYARDK